MIFKLLKILLPADTPTSWYGQKILCAVLFQAVRLKTEVAAVSYAFRSLPLGGSVTACQATNSTKMASAALPQVSHNRARIRWNDSHPRMNKFPVNTTLKIFLFFFSCHLNKAKTANFKKFSFCFFSRTTSCPPCCQSGGGATDSS